MLEFEYTKQKKPKNLCNDLDYAAIQKQKNNNGPFLELFIKKADCLSDIILSSIQQPLANPPITGAGGAYKAKFPIFFTS